MGLDFRNRTARWFGKKELEKWGDVLNYYSKPNWIKQLPPLTPLFAHKKQIANNFR